MNHEELKDKLMPCTTRAKLGSAPNCWLILPPAQPAGPSRTLEHIAWAFLRAAPSPAEAKPRGSPRGSWSRDPSSSGGNGRLGLGGLRWMARLGSPRTAFLLEYAWPEFPAPEDVRS